MKILIVAMFSYLLGSIPTSFIFAKLLKGIDIREHGSGNVGATNLLRTVGKVPGAIALILDVLKGVIPVVFFSQLLLSVSPSMNLALIQVMLGLLAVCGHIWTPFLRFKGGKGVATTIGVFIGLDPFITLYSLLIWCIFVFLFKYISLGSISMAVSLVIQMYIFNKPYEYTILSIILCIAICYRHKSNITRIINGEEPKVGSKSSK
ncbi:glycerol-3-phosphate 1-O-acyltransferase PlsY [Candidatus Omnitrophota bacterium]